jgi:hypothetical protein
MGKTQKSVQRPFCSQSPYLVGSGPFGPKNSGGDPSDLIGACPWCPAFCDSFFRPADGFFLSLSMKLYMPLGMEKNKARAIAAAIASV